jgi:hypothetical protein
VEIPNGGHNTNWSRHGLFVIHHIQKFAEEYMGISDQPIVPAFSRAAGSVSS